MRASRVAIVSLCPGHGYKGFDDIRQDVESIIMEKKPDGVQGEVRYLTDAPSGKTLPGRKTLFRDTKFLVEDVLDTTGEVTRRLLAVNCYNRIQAQVIMEPRQTGDGVLAQTDPAWGLVTFRPQAKLGANCRLIDFAYNRAAFLGVAAFGGESKHKGTVLGLGSGILGSFIKEYLQTPELTEVEVDAQVVDLAKKYFAYSRPAVVADASEYVRGSEPSSQDFIIADLDDFSVEHAVPPNRFINSEFAQNVKAALKDQGVFVTIVSHRNGSSAHFSQILVKEFAYVYEMPALKEEYSVVIAEKSPEGDWDSRKKHRIDHLKKTVFNFNTCDDWAENDFSDMLDKVQRFQN